MDVHTRAKRPAIERFIRNLPAVLAGRAADPHGIAAGFRARVAFAFLSLVKVSFNVKGRGGVDSAGESWAPLSRRYLAYQRPKTGRGRPRAGGQWPGGKDGFMTKEQLKTWRREYARALRYFIAQMAEPEAKARAAAAATARYKSRGGRTKLDDPAFGGRRPGQYQILVDRGILRRSLSVGQFSEAGPRAHYSPAEGQVFRHSSGELLIGTNVPYAGHHHRGRGKRRRRLWPERLPVDWARQINRVAASGIARIVAVMGGSL